jgi:hypothetical protein
MNRSAGQVFSRPKVDNVTQLRPLTSDHK